MQCDQTVRLRILAEAQAIANAIEEFRTTSITDLDDAIERVMQLIERIELLRVAARNCHGADLLVEYLHMQSFS